MDLWHDLKVPNDVDLLRQLAGGMLTELLLHQVWSLTDTFYIRGITGYNGRTVCAEGTGNKEEREKRQWCSASTPGQTHQHPSQGRDRSLQGLSACREVDAPTTSGGFHLHMRWFRFARLFYGHTGLLAFCAYHSFIVLILICALYQ